TCRKVASATSPRRPVQCLEMPSGVDESPPGRERRRIEASRQRGRMGTEEIRVRPADDRVRALLAAGDVPGAVTEALRTVGPDVLGSLPRGLGTDADWDEVFAVVSERLWKSLHPFEWRCSLRTWSHVIARHEIERFRRGARRHVQGRVPISQLA